MVHLKHKRIASTRWFFIVISAVVLYLSWRIVEPLALTLITAIVFAIVLAPLERKLRQVVRYKSLSSGLIVVAAFLVVVVPVFLIAILVVDQAQDVIRLVNSEDSPLRDFDVSQVPAFSYLPGSVQEWLLTLDVRQVGGEAARWVVVRLQAGLSDAVRVLLNSAVFFVALYFFLHDRERLHQEVLVLSPLKDRIDEKITHRISSIVRSVVFGALIIAIIQGILAAIGLSIFGVPGAIFWGALAMIAAQIPLLGVGLIMVPAIAYLIFSGDTGAALGLTIWAVVVVGMIDNLLSPILIQGRTKMHALLILISVLGGLQMFGPIGFIVGPTVLAAFLIVIDLYKGGILETK